MFSPELFEPFVNALLAKNRLLNLMSKGTDAHTLMYQHVYDSVHIAEYMDFNAVSRLLDIGSGGGLPGVPLAIMFPELHVTLVDSVEKKMRAVKEIAEKIGLTNINTFSMRAEALGHDPVFREAYDIVTARAVSALPTLLEYALPFVKVGGHFIAYKGSEYEKELNVSLTALQKLGGSFERAITYDLPDGKGHHVYLIFKKTCSTPREYPRRVGMPEKRPLK